MLSVLAAYKNNPTVWLVNTQTSITHENLTPGHGFHVKVDHLHKSILPCIAHVNNHNDIDFLASV